MAVLVGHGKVPVRVQRDAGGERHKHHVEVGEHHDAEQDLPAQARPLEGEEVDVEEEDGDLGEAERERVEEDAIPGCLRHSFRVNGCQNVMDCALTFPQAMAEVMSLGSRSHT